MQWFLLPTWLLLWLSHLNKCPGFIMPAGSKCGHWGGWSTLNSSLHGRPAQEPGWSAPAPAIWMGRCYGGTIIPWGLDSTVAEGNSIQRGENVLPTSTFLYDVCFKLQVSRDLGVEEVVAMQTNNCVVRIKRGPQMYHSFMFTLLCRRKIWKILNPREVTPLFLITGFID